MWRHEDIFFAAMGGGDPTTVQGPISHPDEIVERVLPTGAVMLLMPPLMHVSAQWGAFSILYGGGTVVLRSPGSLDAHEVWSLVGKEHVNVLTVVGDAMARPLLDAFAADPVALRRVVAVRVRVGRRGAVGVRPRPRSRRCFPT